MKIECKFRVSAADRSQFPAPDVPEVAFLGRSNVGKSSVLNSLVRARIAHVSSTPGRTRTINFFDVNLRGKAGPPDLRFVDLPGYGYAKLSKSVTAEWPRFINPYLQHRENLLLCVVLVDSNVPSQRSDLQLLDFLRHARRELLVVGTKADRLSGNKLKNALKTLERELGVESILPYSARTGAGREELWTAIREATTKPAIVSQKS